MAERTSQFSAAKTVSVTAVKTQEQGVHDTPALWRVGRLLLLELSSISTIVGAGLSDAGALWVETVVGGVVVEVVPLAVVVVVVVEVVVVVVAVVSVGSATVASTVSRTSSASLSSDWFSVT